jgi:UDP-3-O-[3-hydroxymyristoyl] glucosamine N-acyltransferase
VTFKRPWTDGTAGVTFTPLEFVERLAALVPAPRAHLVQTHGVLAGRSAWRRHYTERDRSRNHRNEVYCRVLPRCDCVDDGSVTTGVDLHIDVEPMQFRIWSKLGNSHNGDWAICSPALFQQVSVEAAIDTIRRLLVFWCNKIKNTVVYLPVGALVRARRHNWGNYTMTRSAPLVLAIGLLVPILASAQDACPLDPDKDAPGLCGCGVADSDWDGDLEMDSCIDRTVVLPVGTVVGLAARVDSGATVQTGVVLGPDSHVGAGAFVGTDSFLASQASIGTGASVGADSVLGRRASVGPDANLGDNAFIGRSASIDGGFTVAAGGTLTLGYAAQLNGTPESVGHHITLGNLVSVEAASIGNNVVFARSTTVGAGTTIGNSVVMGPSVDILTDAVIGNGVRMRKDASIGADSYIGDNSRIGRGVDVQARACVGNDVQLGADVIVQTWGDITDNALVRRGTTVAGEAGAPSCLSLGQITLVSGALQWDDGTVANSCWFYRNPTDSHVYGEAGSGIYRVDPNGGEASDAFNVYCDMDFEGGGWTLVDNDPTNAATFGSRSSGAITDLTQAGGRLLPGYAWSNDPLLLCKSNRFTGSVGWLTLAAGGSIALQYPTVVSQSRSHTAGWAARTLNGNTNQGMTSWIYNGSGRFGSVWIGNGGQSTCSCNYTGASTGLGSQTSASTTTCSTWVR